MFAPHEICKIWAAELDRKFDITVSCESPVANTDVARMPARDHERPSTYDQSSAATVDEASDELLFPW
ncbi:uncharacterized protein RCO7_14541 [Rhynchosporium graminicola]|uniref:Uncharacterized protein n=1 Tax=Rhynchosporium graminicola TaxID=2792576 RepID=A0A1E1KMR7_9HELO|nr:uncharacterized protein RCO7_14541 [Rhynchosporium commune]